MKILEMTLGTALRIFEMLLKVVGQIAIILVKMIVAAIAAAFETKPAARRPPPYDIEPTRSRKWQKRRR